MSEKLSAVYKKYLYGGDTSTGGSLYANKASKKQPKIPDLLMSAPTPFGMVPTMVPKTETREEPLIVPKADDVPDVPLVKPVTPTPIKHTITPSVQTFKVPGTIEFPKGFNIDQFKREIRRVESDGMGGYQATNKNSSATGAYQFIWSLWGDKISKVTGVKSQREFLKSKEAQEKYMDHYTKTTILPAVERLRGAGRKRGLSDADIGKLIHFQGVQGATDQIKSGKFAGKTTTNLSVDKYLRKSKG